MEFAAAASRDPCLTATVRPHDIDALAPAPVELKVMNLPSGDQRGCSLLPSVVSWTSSLPSGVMEWIWNPPLLTAVEDTVPFGDQLGLTL